MESIEKHVAGGGLGLNWSTNGAFAGTAAAVAVVSASRRRRLCR